MLQRKVFTIASVVALLATAACSDDAPDPRETDAGGMDGGRPDAGDSGRDANFRADAEAGRPPPDSGRQDDDELDAAADAEVGRDAANDVPIADAGRDAANDATDAAADAAADAGSDAGQLPALAAWYKFDENTGTAAADNTGSFANATLENGANWTTGKVGSALNLAGGATGTNSNFASLPPTILDSCSDVTIALWMKLNTAPLWSRLLEIDSKTNGFLYFTATQDIGGKPHLLFNIYSPPPGPGADQRVSAPYPAGTVLEGVWHHVAFTLAAGTGRLYFDGVEIGSNPMTKTTADLTIGPTSVAWIGRTMFPDRFLDGAIDDLRISCTAYSAAQVAALAQ